MKLHETSKTFMTLYQSLYQNLHSTWNKDERAPSTEAIAVMNHLLMSGPLTVSEAAQHFNRGQSTMSELIDRLQNNGYVDRIKDSRDKRRVLIWLTEQGREVYERSQEVLDRNLLEKSLACMDAQQRQVLLDGMQTLVTASQSILTQRRNNHE